MKFYQRHWTEEGIFWRRDEVVIRKETLHKDFQIRRVKSIPGKLEPGECDAVTERLAFRKGNKLVNLMKKEQRIADRLKRAKENKT
jgi:hypothetical protein